mgnify:CR=1 FL=1
MRERRETVGLEHGRANAPRRSAQVGHREGHSPGHGEMEPTNGRCGERLREGVGGLVGGGDVDEAERAPVDDLVAQAMVAGVDVGALAAVGEDVGAELDARLVVLEAEGR